MDFLSLHAGPLDFSNDFNITIRPTSKVRNVKLILGSEPKKIATFFPAVEAHCFEPIARAPNNFGSAHPSSKNRLGEWRLTLDAP